MRARLAAKSDGPTLKGISATGTSVGRQTQTQTQSLGPGPEAEAEAKQTRACDVLVVLVACCLLLVTWGEACSNAELFLSGGQYHSMRRALFSSSRGFGLYGVPTPRAQMMYPNKLQRHKCRQR